MQDSPDFDLLIAGAGPAGLAAAIRAKQCAREAGVQLSVCVLEKGAEPGAHILSGAMVDPRALEELLPDWRERGAPLLTRVCEERQLFLTAKRAWGLPPRLVPASLHGKGLFLGSLGDLCRWLALEAEGLGVEIYSGFAAVELLRDAEGAVCGLMTGEMGRRRDGSTRPGFQPGTPLRARHVLLAEGARGSLSRQAEAMFDLRRTADPQTFSLGLKELWRVPTQQHKPGLALHAFGWPLGHETSGGAFCYHYGEDLVSIGLVAGLEFRDPAFSPFEQFQRLKTHPYFRSMLEGGRCLAYGARTLATGGWQSLPSLAFPGGAMIGDAAGTLDASRNKGIHTAIKCGMLAAEVAFAKCVGAVGDGLDARVRNSWLGQDLWRARNFKPALKFGLWGGSLLAGLDQLILRGRAPWTLRNRADCQTLARPAALSASEEFRPDGTLTFSREQALSFSGVSHTEDQPCHLQRLDPELSITMNHRRYGSPETRYCPAGVYEILHEASGPRLQINAANCLHCKACDIKDPAQNIRWTPPQGGEGPFYAAM